jgi:hypothetical protein
VAGHDGRQCVNRPAAATGPEPCDPDQDKLRQRVRRRGRREFRRLPGAIAVAPCRTCPGAGRCGRHGKIRPAGARPLRRRTTISCAGQQRASWDSHPGQAGILKQRTAPMPRAWRICRWPGTSLTPSVAQSPWPIYGLRKVVCARQCAPMSRDCSWRRQQGAPVLRGTADMYVGMSELHRERNDLMPPRSTC